MQYRCDEKDSDPSQQSVFSTEGGFEFKNLPLFKQIFDKFPPHTCEKSLTNLFAWGPIYDYSWFFYRGRLIIYDGQNKIMMMPVGCTMSPDELYALSHDMIFLGQSPHICMVSKAYIDENPTVHEYFTVEADRSAAEYIYRIESLIRLSGEKLHKKKNLVSQFHRRYPEFKVLPMDESLREDALLFTQGQLVGKQNADSLETELTAMRRVFSHWDELGMGGLVIMVQDRIAAFSVFSRLNPDTFNVHFEKADLTFKGAAQVINQETAKYLEPFCTYLNREQDLGIPGLRQAKLSYEPYKLFIPHILKLKQNA